MCNVVAKHKMYIKQHSAKWTIVSYKNKKKIISHKNKKKNKSAYLQNPDYDVFHVEDLVLHYLPTRLINTDVYKYTAVQSAPSILILFA